MDWREQEGNANKAFPSFAKMLAQLGTPNGESDFSWTVDFTARRAQAHEYMAPHLDEVGKRKIEAVSLKEELAKLKKAKASEEEISKWRAALDVVERAGREAQAKADAIDAASYDLKAVNPRARVEQDTRTTEEVLESIAEHGRTVDGALARLRQLMAEAQ